MASAQLPETTAFMLERQSTQSTDAPKGLLRVNATVGFGRNHIAPLMSKYAKLYPGVQVQLPLTVHPLPVTDEAFDLCCASCI